MLSVALVSMGNQRERSIFGLEGLLLLGSNVRESEEMWGSHCKGELHAAKPGIKDDGTESRRKHMLVSVHGGVDGFGLG